ncbi:ABC transporter substrate-binding protein [Brevibacterium album]|uniref:ABC transporter substrate-binding protein n=1 Tax=Brevibacterium album TaxID=417948 RepID=UPI00040F6B77|nr:ABC transporter substrate-binding protein [Brevibacterium album]
MKPPPENRRTARRLRARMRLVPGLAAVGALALISSACGADSDPFESGGGETGTVVIGSQQYYSNTLIAEVYAQVLEDAGLTVQRDFEIGQREVYAAELENGNIDVFPEYAGSLLQYFDPESQARTAEEIRDGLEQALPEGLAALRESEATDQNAMVVTAEFAQEHGLTSIGDLADLDDLVVGSTPEFETRPYGPEGLREVYGVEVQLQTIDDSGGPLTVKALEDGDIDVAANIFTASPAIAAEDLVVLEDPESLVPPENVVPIVSEALDADARAALEEVSAALTQEELLELNTRSVDEQAAPEVIAGEWVEEQGLVG